MAPGQERELGGVEGEVPADRRGLRRYFSLSRIVVLSNKKKRKEYDETGTIDENDDEFNDFLSGVDFSELAAMLLGDMLLSDKGGKRRGKARRTGKKKGMKSADDMLDSMLLVWLI